MEGSGAHGRTLFCGFCGYVARSDGPRVLASCHEGGHLEPLVGHSVRNVRRMQFQQAFTLVELLVVTGIFAVLAAIGFSLSAPAREKARQAKCISNLKQIYQAVALYSSDHEGAPSFPDQPGIVFFYRGIDESLGAYAKDKSIFYCPDFPEGLIRSRGSSYEFRWLTFREGSLESDPDWAASLIAELERDPTRFPMIRCGVHDKLYYYPREKHYDQMFSKAFMIDLRFDGSVVSHRIPFPRIDFIPN